MAEQTNKPDFTSVQSTAILTPSDPAARADFSNAESQVHSPVDESTNYIVQDGDDLPAIAKRFYGDANAWKAIFETNRDQLADPDQIRPGQTMKIPPKP